MRINLSVAKKHEDTIKKLKKKIEKLNSRGLEKTSLSDLTWFCVKYAEDKKFERKINELSQLVDELSKLNRELNKNGVNINQIARIHNMAFKNPNKIEFTEHITQQFPELNNSLENLKKLILDIRIFSQKLSQLL